MCVRSLGYDSMGVYVVACDVLFESAKKVRRSISMHLVMQL